MSSDSALQPTKICGDWQKAAWLEWFVALVLMVGVVVSGCMWIYGERQTEESQRQYWKSQAYMAVIGVLMALSILWVVRHSALLWVMFYKGGQGECNTLVKNVLDKISPEKFSTNVVDNLSRTVIETLSRRLQEITRGNPQIK